MSRKRRRILGERNRSFQSVGFSTSSWYVRNVAAYEYFKDKIREIKGLLSLWIGPTYMELVVDGLIDDLVVDTGATS